MENLCASRCFNWRPELNCITSISYIAYQRPLLVTFWNYNLLPLPPIFFFNLKNRIPFPDTICANHILKKSLFILLKFIFTVVTNFWHTWDIMSIKMDTMSEKVKHPPEINKINLFCFFNAWLKKQVLIMHNNNKYQFTEAKSNFLAKF